MMTRGSVSSAATTRMTGDTGAAGVEVAAAGAGLAGGGAGRAEGGSQAVRRIRTHPPRRSSRFSWVPCTARPTTGPLGEDRRFSPSGLATARLNPERLAAPVDAEKIQASKVASRHPSEFRPRATLVPACRVPSCVPRGAAWKGAAPGRRSRLCAPREEAASTRRTAVKAGRRRNGGLDCGAFITVRHCRARGEACQRYSGAIPGPSSSCAPC
jgi:hypothetical protein